jgi:hypothetical protein
MGVEAKVKAAEAARRGIPREVRRTATATLGLRPDQLITSVATKSGQHTARCGGARGVQYEVGHDEANNDKSNGTPKT